MLIDQSIFTFLSELKKNNNRDWFANNKEWYQKSLHSFEQLIDYLLNKISKIDPELEGLTAKDCIFRIYRDIRFSPNKAPYKTQFGAFMAAPSGRKSERAGYYLHLEPNNSFIASGVWCPPPSLLKELRQSIYDNINEFEDIRKNPVFETHFPSLYEEGKLINVPRGFPKDFPHADLLKLKHYLVSCDLKAEILSSDDFSDQLLKLCRTALPFNMFLNYTVDEWLTK